MLNMTRFKSCYLTAFLMNNGTLFHLWDIYFFLLMPILFLFHDSNTIISTKKTFTQIFLKKCFLCKVMSAADSNL